MRTRPLYLNIWKELSGEKSMVFMAGPRQVGKTTLCRQVMGSFTNSLYFNWDVPQDRTRLLEDPAFFEHIERKNGSVPLVVFDEIHKYRDWKNYLKGSYDRYQNMFQFLISGSGRLGR